MSNYMTCRTTSINAELQFIVRALVEVNETHRDEYGKRAAGFHALMEKFSTFFGLKLAYLIFCASEQLLITLQSINTTAQHATIAVNVARSFYNRQRDPLVKDADGKTERPVLPRYRNLPRKRSMTGLQNSGFLMWRSYEHHYFELMESLSGELARCFDQRGLNLATQFERIIIDSCNGTACEKPQEIMDLYARDLDI